MARRFNRKPPTEAEREARRKADRERLEQAARTLLTSDGWQRWIKVRATNGLSRYSVTNLCLISAACHARGINPDLRRGVPRLPRPESLCPQGPARDSYCRAGHRQGPRRARRGDRREASLLPDRERVGRLDDRALAWTRSGAAHAAGRADHRRQPPPPDRAADRSRRRARLYRRDPRPPRRRPGWLVRPRAQADRRQQRARQQPGPDPHA